MATSVFVAMAQSKLLKFLLFLTTLILSVNGQSVNVTIITDPNMASYTVGDNLTLTCMVDPLPTSTATNVSYSWNCSGCFADGMNSSVFNQVLTDMDSSNISCSATLNGTVYRSDVFDLRVTQAPPPTVTLDPNSVQGAMVGSPLTIECRVGTVPGVSSVLISWTRPGGVTIMNNDRISISPTTSNSNVFTSNLQFEYLMEGDEGNYTCNWTILGNSGSESVEIQSLMVPDPIVSVFVRNTRGVDLTAIIAQTVGQPLTLWCVAITVRGITSRVDIVWREGDRVLNRTNGTNAATFGISLMYTSSYNISQLNTTDDGRVIECEVVINASPSVMASGNITLDVTVPNFMVRIEPRSDELTVGDEAIIDCTVSTVSGVELSSVMISWIGPRGVITNDSRVTITPTTSSDNSFNNSVIFEYLEEINIGTYTCNVMILDTSRSQSVELSSLNVTIPTPAVSVTALNNQTVGQPLTLQCNVTTVRGITSRVDIVWSNGSTVLQRMNNVSSTMMSNSLVYTNSYNISILSITNDGDVIQCEVEINTSPPILANGDITLDVMVPSPNVTISPPGPTLGAMVGSPQDINCTVSTVSGVESSLVIISWMGPGVSITNESRVTISPTTFDGSNYISSLSFEYLAEEDEGIYMCNVTILDTRESESIAMSLTIPDPIVSVFVSNTHTVDLTALSAQTVGQPLTLWCVVTPVRGITSRVDIVWREGDRVLNRTNATTLGILLVYIDSYNISQLNTTDDGRVIQCEVVINANPSVMASGNITLDVTVPNFMVRIEPRSDELTVGDEAIIDCTVSTVSGVELSSVTIIWIGPRGVITNDSRVIISPTTSSGNNYTSSLWFTYLMEGDKGTYTCNVMILDTSESQSVDLSSLNVVVPPPTVSVTATRNQTVGQSLTLQCEVTTVRGITSRVDIVWSSGGTELQRINNVLPTMMSDSLVYTNFYNISLLSTANDDNVIQCEVEINTSPLVMANGDITLDVTVPTPNVTISGPTLGAMVGSPQDINCTVSTVSGVESSSVIISWTGPGGAITNESRVTISPTTSDGSNYISSLSFEYLVEEDEGTYMCSVTILNTRGSESIEMSLTIPDPTVFVVFFNNQAVNLIDHITQTVGQPLTLRCVAITVRGITSRVDIVWREGDRVLNRTNGTNGTTATTRRNSLEYTDTYDISQLNTTDDGRVIQYEVVINASPSVMASGNITLDVTVPNFMVRIEPRSDELTVGDEAMIDCTVNTVSGVELSSVMIIWIGPRGVITNDSRVIISPTTSSGKNYTSSLQFTYLMEGDEGTYTCNVMILDTSGSQSVNLSSLVPPPTVNVTALNTQTVGQSLTLQCVVTTVRGITSRVDIVWSSGGTELQRTNVSSTMTNNSLAYTNSYTISQLSTDDQDTVYWCCAGINSIPVVADNDSIALNVTIPEPLIVIVPSGSGSFSGLDYSLTCTVTVAPGVSPSLVMVNWDRQNFASPSSSISDISINGLEYTRTITFSPLFRNDGGQYTCSASVNGFNEASGSLSTMVVVNAPVTLTLTPLEIIDDAGDDIKLLCEADEEDSVSADYMFAWWFNDDPVNQSDVRIDITDSDMNSTITVSNTTGADSGYYTCQLTLTVADRDNFTLSESAIVILSAMEPPLVPVVTNVITTPFSANISWIVQIIVNDMESHTVLYGTNMSSLTNSSEVILGSNDSSTINEMFTVNIDGLMPFTTYYFIVSATNSEGTTNTSIMDFLTNQTVPDEAPGNLRSINVTANSIEFEWDQLPPTEANGIITSYTVSCTSRSSSTMGTFNDTMGTVTGLSPFTMYGCTVLATTVSPGPVSDPTNVTTLESAPNPPVINEVVNISDSSVCVTWTRPTMLNGIITTYTISYTAGSNSSSVTVPYNAQETQSFDITGLSPYQLVTVTITATNGGGTSGPSDEVSGRSSEAAPNPPVINEVVNISDSSVRVTWTRPTMLNGIITTYTISYTAGSNSSSVTVPYNAQETQSYNITGLSPYQLVTVTITATNGGGTSGPSDKVSGRSSEAAPNPPVINEIVNISDSSVRVTWTRPTMLNGIITTYTISYTAGSNSSSMTVPYNGQETQSYNITGLSPYQLVTVNITATNGGGTSDPSDEVSGRSSEAAPGVVQTVRTNGSLVTWEAPMVPNGIITGYEVFYFIYDEENELGSSSRLSDSTTSFDIPNLTEGIPYDVTIVAFTSAGGGPQSDRVTFFSQELPPSRTVDLSTVNTMMLSETSINVTWEGLTLFEAQGFPVYIVTIVLMTDNNRKRRQSTPDRTIITVTGSTYVVFNRLVPGGRYSGEIGVRSRGAAMQGFMMSVGSINIIVSPPNATASPTPTTSPTSAPTPTTTPTPTPSAGPTDDDDDGANGGAIAGGVIAAIIVVTIIVVIIVIIVVLRVRKRTKSFTIAPSKKTFVNKGVDSSTQSGTAGDNAMQNIDPKLEQRLEPIPLSNFSEHAQR